ncbi:cytochrome c family protein, putative [Lunatimonas lonarensis]|uniref:Cytochrome c family protein, putative n=1 Tax=Lunatimonas lonarensis TaxID=1232681 RepID=R7ZTI9_9BACT|nr:DUF3365 domain-containing protein [Lunatimonas lonarensis]EON77353.1 cytochrome c family protein, putative [Lunatimonas lonarensis]
MKPQVIFYIFFFALLISCGSEKSVDRETFREIQKSTEIKKVNEAELVEFAMKWGDQISAEAQKSLVETLQKVIADRGLAGAVDFCHAEALPITKEVAEKHRVAVKRVSLKNRNPANAPNDMEKNLLEAYAYNLAQGMENQPNIQKLDNGEVLLYTKAIVIPGGICLSCHGDPGSEIEESTLAKISEKYPHDKATGYKAGELRGMWSIAIPRKEAIRNM